MFTKLKYIPSMFFIISFSFIEAANADNFSWNGTVLGFEPQKPGLFDHFLSIRNDLHKEGFDYNLVYLTQSAYNAGGGYNHDKHLAFIDQLSLTFTQDLEIYTGIPDAKIEGNIVNRNHNDELTTLRVQNPRVRKNDSTQESSGGESITRLGWMTFSRSFDNRKLSWRVGLVNKSQLFDKIVPCDFQTLMLCGGKSTSSGTWSNWNKHVWGTTLSYKLTDELLVKGGVLEQNPQSSSRSHAWSWSTKGSKGVLLPLEIEMKTHVNELPGVYNLGTLYTNAPQKDLYTGNVNDVDGSIQIENKTYDHTWFIWGGFNQQITRHNGDVNRGLSASFNFSYADQRTVPRHTITALSLRYRGLFDLRPEDWIGIGISHVDASKHYARNQEYLNQLSGITNKYDNRYNPVPSNSTNIELFYRFRPYTWIELQPGIQYWHNPAGIKETQDAYVLEMKTAVSF